MSWVIGVTGGVGCGKSRFLEELSLEIKAYVILADDIGRGLQEPGTKQYDEIVEVFGKEVLLENGKFNRGLLGMLAFSDENKLKALNNIIHPAVKERIEKRIESIIKEDPEALIFVEAALLLEADYDSMCNEVWYIYADTETRFKRLSQGRGMTRESFDRITKMQLSEYEFRLRSNFVIDNSGYIEASVVQARRHLSL